MSEFLDPSQEIQTHGGKLPHWQQPDSMQFVTFRLVDALPAGKLRLWKEEHAIWKSFHPKPWTVVEEREYLKRFVWRVEKWLDEGSGSCLLKLPTNREPLETTLMHDDSIRADHHSWVIMPNHVHLLFTAHYPLEKLLKCWKGVSARRIGLGRIWQKNYRDTMIRDEEHFAKVVRYIRKNPAKLMPGSFTLYESPRALSVR